MNYFINGNLKYDMGFIDGMHDERERVLALLEPYTYCSNQWACGDGCTCLLLPQFLMDRIKKDLNNNDS